MMIIDTISNYKFYSKNSEIEKIFTYLINITDYSDRVFYNDGIKYNIQTYQTRQYSDESVLECHKEYCDIQLIVSGEELLGYSVEGFLYKDYDKNKDISFFKSNPSFLRLKQNDFVVLFPNEKHIGGIGDSSFVKKIVVKCPVSLFSKE